jgi:hypothetical protein
VLSPHTVLFSSAVLRLFLLCSFPVLLFAMASNDDWVSAFQTTSLRASPSPTLASGVTVVSSGTLVSTPTVASVSPTTSSLAGVSSGEYGGGAKRAHLFSYDPAASLCLGYVDSAGLHFCIKPVLVGKSDGTCGVGKHISKFQPDQSFYYLRGNDVTAYCLPAFPQARLPSEIQLQLPMLKKTNQEWKDLFSRYESVSKLANADSANAAPVGVGKLVFKTPKKLLPSSDDEIPPVFVPSELWEIEMQAELAMDEALWWMEDDDAALLSSWLMQFLRDVRSFLILYWQ